jgi:hypothetical protein
LETKTYYNYNTTTFPSWCGKSATFLYWLESDTQAGGYLLARYDVSYAVRPPKVRSALCEFAHVIHFC